jgi:Fe-S-cluster-containing dehydrogenase component
MAGYGLLVNLDRCTGCMACEAACKSVHNLPAGVSWLHVIRNRPEEVDGKLVMDHIPMPRSLKKCEECVSKETPPLCAKVCMGKALRVDKVEQLLSITKKRRSVLFSS